MTNKAYNPVYSHDDTNLGNPNQSFNPELTIRENNFHLDQQERLLITQKVESTLELAPAHSCTIVTLTKNADSFKGAINISSYFVSFESTSEGSDPLDVVKSMCRDIKDQLSKWKQSRFDKVNVDPSGYLQAI